MLVTITVWLGYNTSMGIGFGKTICEQIVYSYIFVKIKTMRVHIFKLKTIFVQLIKTKNHKVWLPWTKIHMRMTTV